MRRSQLKKLRVALALFFFTALTLLFLDFTGTVHAYLGWCAKVQLVPAILATQTVIFASIIFLTLLLGRVYCSTICPLGVFQDVVSRLAKKTRFSYNPPRKVWIILRYVLILIFILPLFLGKGGLVNVIDPYSMFGRMVSLILGPVYKYGNNLLAYFAERFDSYAFYSVDIWIKGSAALVLAIVSFVVVVTFALKSGRKYCNRVCPVGAFLGLLSKYSMFKVRIDNEKCKGCGICAKNCKASCIDAVNKRIDYSECVSCFNCIKSCPKGAMRYALHKSPDKLSDEGQTRRNFISKTALLASGFVTCAIANEFDGGLARLEDKKAPQRSKPVVPAGADSWKNFHDRCIGCQLCVTVCSNQVLRTDKTKPHMSFERGYCRPECVQCSGVCPTGAIRSVTRAEKSSIQIGTAIWKSNLCIVNTRSDNCDLCSRKCPTGAISRIPKNADDPNSLKIPMIDPNRCTGCGACEHLCPARPHSAIYVEGVETHRRI
ncbi:MAG: 4Fe-4S binding protein [Fibromonadaceae bacterium]|jgi:polyferredoxin|nr:4Fe-4S binding protein [Fibromonadaceae bacterium]